GVVFAGVTGSGLLFEGGGEFGRGGYEGWDVWLW
ncbi:hypothetical protein A2U01_0117055, partial [Trifolium medium]|nr:hypothetical protein [Trifolium medium]